MKSGYSRKVFDANIAGLQRSGVDRNSAIYTAASHARKCYFAAHPAGALPLWLAFPKSARLREHYGPDGKPRMIDTAGLARVRDNPKADPAALAQAKQLYRGFTGTAPRTLKLLDENGKSIPIRAARSGDHFTPLRGSVKIGLAIGKVLGIIYSVDATNERFKHDFSSKARPTLIVASDGKSVYLRGGAYTFTNRGFVDSK